MTSAPDAIRLFDGRYLPLQCLKRSRRTLVYLAERIDTGERVVIKCLAEDTAVRRERLQREARALSRVSSPYLAGYVDFIDGVDVSPALVTEFVDGRPLSLTLRDRPVTPQEAYRILMQMLCALRALHGQGVLHRDVAPQNILVENRAEGAHARLIDLGFASVPGSLRVTRIFEVVGSAHYMAPEQWFRKPLDERADLYGLALVGLTMLRGGKPLITGRGAVEMCQAHLEMPRNPMSMTAAGAPIPPALDLILRRAADPDRNQRFTNAQAMMDALAPIGWAWQ